MRPFNKREGKKKPGQPRDGGDTGVFLMGYLVAYSSSEEKKKSARGPQSRRAEDVIIWINLD